MLREPRKLFFIGGLISSLVLAGFGAAMIIIGYNGINEVHDTLRQENITTAADSSDPGKPVVDGATARVQADIMREHTLKQTNGLTYSQMGSYQLASNPTDPKGTSDKNLAAKDAAGNPIANGPRNTWVTETALTTALNTAYFAENVGNFAVVVGIALFLTGGGFAVLTVGAFHFTAAKKDQKASAGQLVLANNPS
jgi:hypothetical protein